MDSRTPDALGRSQPQGRRHSHTRRVSPLSGLTILLLTLACPPAMQANTIHCPAGDAACLVAAIRVANVQPGPQTEIRLAAGTYTLTGVDNDTDGPNGLPSITGPLAITGAGADRTIIARAPTAPPFRLLHIGATGTLTVHGLTLTGGVAQPPGKFVASIGGGLFNADGVVALRQTRVTGNVAMGDGSDSAGGGVSNAGVMTIADSLIAENGAFGFSGAGGGVSNTGELTVTDTIIAQNGVGSLGDGAGFFNRGTLTLLRSTVRGHTIPQGSGSGIQNRGRMTIAQSTISDNVVGEERGGGILNAGGTLVITNSTIAENVADGTADGGAGIVNSFGAVTVTNSTIAGNQVWSGGGGGGLLNEGGTVALQNTILAHNESFDDRGPRGAPDCSGPVTSRGHTLIGDAAGCDVTPQAGDLAGEPGLGAFTDDGTPGHGHFPLLATSRAIAAGDAAACPPTDQLGQLRGVPCDLGAIEFYPVPLTLRLNQATFHAGEVLRVGLGARNPGAALTADFYLGLLLPDAVTVVFVTGVAPLAGVVTRLDADPRTFPPLLAGIDLPQGLDARLDEVLAYAVTGGEPPGPYVVFTLLTTPGAFTDPQGAAGGFLAFTVAPFTIGPDGREPSIERAAAFRASVAAASTAARADGARSPAATCCTSGRSTRTGVGGARSP